MGWSGVKSERSVQWRESAMSKKEKDGEEGRKEGDVKKEETT